jgi:hypothetical protein
MTGNATFRLAAVILLLWTGGDLFACEMIGAQSCESFGLTQTDAGGSEDDGCICCCTHVVVVNPMPVLPVTELVTAVMNPAAPKPKYKSFSIYHPPRV